MIRGMTAANAATNKDLTMQAPTGADAPAPVAADASAAAKVAAQAAAARQVRYAADRWLTSDNITVLGQQMVLSTTRYQQLHRRSPTWADAVSRRRPGSARADHHDPRRLAAAPGALAARPTPTPDDRTTPHPVDHLHPYAAFPATRRPRPRLAPHHRSPGPSAPAWSQPRSGRPPAVFCLWDHACLTTSSAVHVPNASA